MTVRVCGAIIRNGAILMVRHRHGPHDYWTLPGGGVEPGESHAEAIVREVWEEVGLKARVCCFLFEWHTPIAKIWERCFLLEIDADQEPTLGYDPELGENSQILQDVAWLPLDSVRDDIHVSQVIKALSTMPAR